MDLKRSLALSLTATSSRSGNMKLRYRVIRRIDELCTLAEQWDALLQKSEADSIFMTYDWINTWISVSGPSLSIYTIVVYNEEELVGIAPFYQDTLALFGLLSFNCLRIQGDKNSSSEYQDLILHPACPSAIIEKIAEAISQITEDTSFFWVPYTSTKSGASGRFQELFERLNIETQQREFEYFKISLPASKTEFDAKLTSKQRNNIRRYKKILAKKDRIRAIDLIDRGSADDAVETLRILHNMNWHSRGKQGVFERKPVFHDFIAAYSTLAREKHQLMAICLLLNERPIAIRFGYLYNNVFFEMQAGYDPEHNGSGICAIDFAIKFSINRQINTYDFLAYAGEYKRRFNAQAQPGRSFFASSRRLLPRLINLLGIWPTGKYISI